MAYSTINKHTDYFNTLLYTGNTTQRSITGVGFQPDWVWFKNRSASQPHCLVDAVRGVNNSLASNSNSAVETDTNDLQAFQSDGFQIGTNNRVNGNGNSMVAWNWKANGSGSSNTDGSITSTVSANTTSGFSIVKFTKANTTDTIGHGLGVAPKMIIIKQLNTTTDWYTYHSALGNTKAVYLNLTNAQSGVSANFWNNTSPTSTVFSVASAFNNQEHIAYCFAENNSKMFKVGSYTGNSSTDGTFIYTGQKVSWFLCKNITDIGDNWCLFDNKRDTFNVTDNGLAPNSDIAQFTDVDMDFLSNGVKMRNSTGRHNATGKTYIYLSIGQPIISNSGICATAR